MGLKHMLTGEVGTAESSQLVRNFSSLWVLDQRLHKTPVFSTQVGPEISGNLSGLCFLIYLKKWGWTK